MKYATLGTTGLVVSRMAFGAMTVSYFSLKDGPENAAWSYEQPYDEMTVIKDLLAFYPDKVEISAS